MKNIVTLLVLTTFSFGAFAQAPVPNGSFENWTTVAPQGWSTIDQLLLQYTFSNPGLVTKETNGANVAAGSKSMKLRTDSVNIALAGQTFVIPGVAVCQKLGLDLATFTVLLDGATYASRPDSFSYQYKYQAGPGAPDTGGVNVRLTKWDVASGSEIPVGNIFLRASNAASFTTAKGKVIYTSALTPDSALFIAASSAPANGAFTSFTGGLGTVGTTFYLDDLQFEGLDTAFKAYIRPDVSRNICAGDTIRLSTDNFPGNTVQWYNGSAPITGAVTPTLTVTAAGTYYVRATHNGGNFYSDTVTIGQNPTPVVTFTGLQDSACRTAAPITLQGGAPMGGRYLGPGVVNGVFTPNTAGTGTKTIVYAYTDSATRCSATAHQDIVVYNCANGIEALENDVQVSLYPNPANASLVIEGNDKLNGGTASVYNMQGQLVATQKMASGKTQLDVQHLPVGNYTIRLSGAKANALAKGQFSIVR